MGWTLHNDNDEDFLWKDGASGGFRSFIGIDRKRKVGIVILSNSPNPTTDMGLQFIDPSMKLTSYAFKWRLLNELRVDIEKKKIDEVIERYHELKATGDSPFLFDPMQLNYLGLELMEAGRFDDAIKVYELNMAEYPKFQPVLEGLVEAYRRSGKEPEALATLEKLSQMDTTNLRWPWLAQRIKNAK